MLGRERDRQTDTDRQTERQRDRQREKQRGEQSSDETTAATVAITWPIFPSSLHPLLTDEVNALGGQLARHLRRKSSARTLCPRCLDGSTQVFNLHTFPDFILIASAVH